MIKAENLVRVYGPIRAVDNISFEVAKGQILGFLGPNGAGKSTTMKMITGFLPPTSGTARVGGFDIRENPLEAKKLMGYLPESGPLYHEMTVTEFLRFAGEMRSLRGAALTRAIDHVTEICHLKGVGHQPIETLSKGYRQRVGMAQAVIHNPPVLIMDEPTDGLDPNQKQAVRELIASMASDKAIILSTHILEEVQAMCNRVIIIDRGKLVVDDTPTGLLRRHKSFNAIQLEFATEEPDAETVKNAFQHHAKIDRVTPGDNGDFVIFPRNRADIRTEVHRIARENNWDVRNIQPVRVRLDEVFRNLTQPT